MKRIVFDFETRSMCDLKKSGGFKYSLDSTTQPTCLAFKVVGGYKIYFLDFKMVNTLWANLPKELKDLWEKFINEGYEFTAHNAFFERCIYQNILVNRYGWPVIPPQLYRCTAAKAAACALPRNLEGAGEAMHLTVQKDRRGYSAMMKTCKPTKAWTAWKKAREEIGSGKKIGAKKKEVAERSEPKVFLDPEDDLATWGTLYTYCKIDVRSEEELDRALPDLTPHEQEIWHLNQELNWRGVPIDLPTVKKITAIMAAEAKEKLQELDHLTMGLVTRPGARQSILDYLKLDGVDLPDIRSKTVEDSLSGFLLTEDARRLLEIRKALSLSSTKKYQSFINRATGDERVRDILLYHGASTGRDTGTGIQVHNLPRGLIKMKKGNPYSAVDDVVAYDRDMLSLIYGEDLSLLFSAILRNMIQATPGFELFVADFSKIEVAVLWWLSDNKPGLKILRDGLDPYKYMAAANTGKKYAEIADDGNDRQLGKAQVLGCGFGMGAVKFQTTAWEMYRLKLTEDQSKLAVKNYREANSAVPIYWRALEEAAVAAVENGRRYAVGQCFFEVSDNFLWATLPSGRKLAYREPRISWRETDWGPRKTLEFMAVNSKTKKWGPERTWGGTLTENIVQAVARDLMMSAALRLEKSGYRVLLTVHDEAICEGVKGFGSVEDFTKIMCEIPSWGKGLPIEAKGWRGPRYRK